MAKKVDWTEDSATLEIALKLVEKYPDLFDGLDLTKVRFVRDLNASGHKIGELKPCGFPYDIDSPYAYYIVANNIVWKELSAAQQNLAVMHFLYAIAPGGTDEASASYAKTRKHDVKDYDTILKAAGGRYDWAKPGATDLPDPLADASAPAPGELFDGAADEEVPRFPAPYASIHVDDEDRVPENPPIP